MPRSTESLGPLVRQCKLLRVRPDEHNSKVYVPYEPETVKSCYLADSEESPVLPGQIISLDGHQGYTWAISNVHSLPKHLSELNTTKHATNIN